LPNVKIGIVAIGSRGDVQPFVALGGGLRRAGHHVRILTHDLYETMTAPLGLELVALSGDIQAMVAAAPKKSDSSLWRNFRENRRNSRAVASVWMSECLKAARGMDGLIVTGSSFFLGAPVAERLGLPVVQAYAQPITPTRAFPSPFFTSARARQPGLVNLALHHMLRQLAWHSFRPAINQARRQVAGVPPWPLRGPWREMSKQRAPVLYAYSQHVVPNPADWPLEHEAGGYWFLESPHSWQPPAELEQFLATSPPPVCIGFSSTPDTGQLTDIVIGAVQQTSDRALLVAGWGGLQRRSLPDNVMAIDEAPFDWLLPKVSVLVHAGGAGTASLALRSGVPSVVVPFMSDQMFWGVQLARLGVAAPPIPHQNLTEMNLASAITRAKTDSRMAQRAAQFAAALRGEDGIGWAVRRIEALWQA
jgi:UDP:flavonoid glycosyltransferase YjiC (YdhE family)